MTQRCVMEQFVKKHTKEVGHMAKTLSPPIKAIVLDAFGTLCEIQDKRGPYGQLARFSTDRQHARELLMTRPLGLREAARELHAGGVDLDALEAELAVELASIQLYPEVIEALEAVRANGVKLAIASNLAEPYAAALLRLLPFEFDVYAWSFQVGFLKPDARIYLWTCEQLGVEPGEAVMVGDTFGADYEGARGAGMRAVHLDRTGQSRRPVQTMTTLDMLSNANDFFSGA
jgi:HAD superfamily hydrolase (TIGR01549 family)